MVREKQGSQSNQSHRAREKKSGDGSGPGGTADSLINAAVALFSKKGYDGTSVKELSEAAGVNISLVSYHFGGKEGLYRACLEGFGQESLEASSRILQPPKTVEEYELRLQMFVELLLDIFVKKPDLAQLAFKEADLETDVVQDIFRKSFLEIYRLIINFFSGAHENHLIDETLDPQTLTSIFFGSISHFARMDHLSNKYFKRTINDPENHQRVIGHIKKIFITNLRR